MKKILSVLLALALALGICGAFAETAALPAFAYTGNDPVEAAVIKYMQETDFGYETPEGGVLIPTPIILVQHINDGETEATVWGNFWIFTYARNGKILECTSGGENPGVLKLEKKDGEWAVVSAEFAGEGEDYQKDIKKFADGDEKLEEQYGLTVGTDGYLPQYQRAAVVEYVRVNNLDIEAFQDAGSDPVSVID